MDHPFIGSEALVTGRVRKHELRSRFQRICPDVYLPAGDAPTVQQRARAAWLWSHREGVIAGVTASALHGAKWVDADEPVELIWSTARQPQGLSTYDDRLRADEYGVLDGMQVTTPLRTAFDIGRRGRLPKAVARLDALGNARRFVVDDVAELARSHRGVRGQRQLAEALDLHDAGAESPKETWLRLLLIEAGFPRPRTQIPVEGLDGRPRYRLDMGWEDVLVAAEYDGEHHRKDRPSYIKDIIRSEYIASVGWIVVRVVAGQSRSDILRRVEAARNSRLR